MNSTIGMYPLLYVAIAVATTVEVLYRGELDRPRVPVFRTADTVTLILAALAVGLLWVLFVPSLIVLAVRRAERYLQRHRGSWSWYRDAQGVSGRLG